MTSHDSPRTLADAMSNEYEGRMFAFCADYASHISGGQCQIRVVVEHETGFHPTNWVAPSYNEGEDLCRKLNTLIGQTEEEVMFLIARSMRDTRTTH